MWRGLPALCWTLALTGCVGTTPTPLAPGLGGSVGVPHDGVLTGGAELPRRGTGFVRYRPKSPNYWGHPRLIRAITDVARAVHDKAPGGAPLVVGDLSARDGGKLPGHRSHRTGRDADFILFATTPSGAPVPTPGFIHYGSDGLAEVEGSYYRLDVERNWLLVKELVQAPDAAVQWIFASRNIEALLVDYARARGEEPYLVWRAETMLLEPGDSTAHDDHLHVRIACTVEDELAGCQGGGPRWPWLSPEPALGDLGTRELGEIAAEDPFELPLAEHGEPHVAGGA